MLRSALRPLTEIRRVLDQYLRPVMRRWGWWQLLVISLIAGVAEEALFRAAIQGGLSGFLPPWAALVLASILFGLCHAVTRAYAAIAAHLREYVPAPAGGGDGD